MTRNEFVIFMVVLVVVFVFALGRFGKEEKQYQAQNRQPQAEKSMALNAPKENQIIGFNGQSTKIDVTEESLSAPVPEMTVQGLRNVRIYESTSVAGNRQHKVAGLSGLKIE